MNDKYLVPVILQQFFDVQINNGGPATGALLLMNSSLNKEFTFIPMSDTFTSPWKLLLYFLKTIHFYKPDIIHIRGVQSIGFLGVLAGKLTHTKVVLSVHGLSIDSEKGLKKCLYKYVIEPYALKNADLVYCVCDFTARRDFIVKHTSNLYGVIYNAAPDYSSLSREDCRKKVRQNHHLDGSDVIVTFISRMVYSKGLGPLIQSIKQLSMYEHIKYLIGGDGPDLPFITNALKSEIINGKVVILGKVNSVGEVLLASDIFIFPSLRENLPNSLLEAAEAGLPIIATNVGGNSEIVSNNYSGLLIEPNNGIQLSDAIKMLSNDSQMRYDMGGKAKQYIEQVFSQKVIFEEMRTMYNSLLNGKD